MKICVFASGSGGNCLLVSAKGTNVLLDAGISMKRIENALRGIGLSINNIDGVLVTHEHSDHVSGLKMLSKHYGVPIFAPRTVAARLRGMLPETEPYIRIIVPGHSFDIGALRIRAFHTPHDTDESVGYRLECGSIFALATDMGHVTDEVEESLTGADAVLVESNHDVAMLSYGPYPVHLKRRILSDRGHLSNDDCAQLVKRLTDGGVGKIILGHLSRENNSPEKALMTTRSLVSASAAELYCAPVLGCLEINI